MKKIPSYISFLKENRTKAQAEVIYNQRIKDSEEVFKKFSDQFIERVCPVCGEQESSELAKFNGQYGVVSCNKCLSTYVNPSPNLDALDYYYNSCECNKQLGNLINNATIYLECWLTVADIKKIIASEENRKAFYSEFQ